MKLIEITNIKHENSPIFYNALYSADAILLDESAEKKTIKTSFRIEQKIAGIKVYREIAEVRIEDKIDYPLLNLTNKIKEYIDLNVL